MKKKTEHLIEMFNQSDFESIYNFLKEGVDPNIRNEYGKTLLSQVCWYAEYNLVELMIKNGVDINADNGIALLLTIITTNGNTPIKQGNTEKILKLLIDNGANLNQIYQTKFQSESNANSLIIAIKNKKLEMANMLIEAGIDLIHKDSHGYDALWWAKNVGYKRLIKKIKEKIA